MNYPDRTDLHQGKFTDGDPIAGIAPSMILADQMNALYDELISVIEGSGITPSFESRDQLLQALGFYRNASNLNAGTVAAGLLPSPSTTSPGAFTVATTAQIEAGTAESAAITPKYLALADVFVDLTGSIHFFATRQAPKGFIKANGATVSRTSYAKLFAKIGSTYGAGNGSTTFKLPDLRGEFIRGWDEGRGADSGRGFGSWQSFAIQNIVGKFDGNNNDRNARTGPFYYTGQATGGSDGARTGEYIGFDASRVVNTAAETRPRNIALMAYIKY